MQLLVNRFGLRKHPKWAKTDLDAHLRLGQELERAFELVALYVPFGFPEEFKNVAWEVDAFTQMSQRERMYYFLNYALRLQRAYLMLMDVLSPFCKLIIQRSVYGATYHLQLTIEDQSYTCYYLNDHVCCLAWVVNKINFHVQSASNRIP